MAAAAISAVKARVIGDDGESHEVNFAGYANSYTTVL